MVMKSMDMVNISLLFIPMIVNKNTPKWLSESYSHITLDRKETSGDSDSDLGYFYDDELKWIWKMNRNPMTQT